MFGGTFRKMYDQKENIRRNVAVIILGTGMNSNRIALRLLRCFGIVSFICSDKNSFFTALNPAVRFCKISPPQYAELLLLQLEYLSKRFTDCLKILIPSNDLYRRFADKYTDRLEEHFIITDTGKITECIPFSVLKSCFDADRESGNTERS